MPTNRADGPGKMTYKEAKLAMESYARYLRAYVHRTVLPETDPEYLNVATLQSIAICGVWEVAREYMFEKITGRGEAQNADA